MRLTAVVLFCRRCVARALCHRGSPCKWQQANSESGRASSAPAVLVFSSIIFYALTILASVLTFRLGARLRKRSAQRK